MEDACVATMWKELCLLITIKKIQLSKCKHIAKLQPLLGWRNALEAKARALGLGRYTTPVTVCLYIDLQVCENKFYKNKDSQELIASLAQQESSPQTEGKDSGMSKERAEESLESRDEGEDVQSRTKAVCRKVDSLASGMWKSCVQTGVSFISKLVHTNENRYRTF